ncbi:SIMPL domain-containing protein [Catenulispora rubra]|uniref:SIMPL domain-containing protein n=1 Tax=Catenulispora rubra TaxID=280293 RepID=UPI0018920CE4|nr:SIMPL domain-containing protein [Catenulispora rubra]
MTDQTDHSAGNPIVVSVRGEANLEADPELCEFAVTVTARDKDRRTALEQLTKRNKELLDQIKADYGDALEKLETGRFSVYPEWRKRTDKTGPYQGTVRIRLVVKDFAVLGEMITRIADGEGRAIDGPYWTLRRDSEVYRKARTEAVGEAVRRAREYADALGSQLTALLELADTGLSTAGSPAPQARMYAMATRGGGIVDDGPPALDLEPTRQSVYAAVEARFSATQPGEL